MQHIGFKLNDKEYTIPILKVREIINSPDLTKLPLVPHYVEGVTNHKGKVVAVVNLKKLVGLDVDGHSKGDKVMVVGSEQMRFGFFVDSITGVLDISESEARTPSQNEFACSMNINNRALTCLDTKRLIPQEDVSRTSRHARLFFDPDAPVNG